MIENVITKETFKLVVQQYVNKNKFSNVDESSLVAAFQPYVDCNFSQFLSTWTRQSGYPLISAQEKGNTVVLTQERFLRKGQEDNLSRY